MKTIVVENLEEGLEKLLGKRVLILCAAYFYEGILVGVNKSCIKLSNAGIVYDTGKWSDNSFSDLQKLHQDEWYLQTALIESFGLSKNV